jgi:hypothetical protein
MPPTLHVDSVQQVYNDGNHNAFTDLIRFRERFYLTFRSCPDGHMLYETSRILVLASDDGEAWELMHAFSVPQRDVRDPHFLLFRDRLSVLSGTWLVPEDPDKRHLNDHQGYAVWTDDGREWHGPRLLLGTHSHYIWRAAAYGDTAYLCGRRIRPDVRGVTPEQVLGDDHELVQSAMLASKDGFSWQEAALFQPEYGNETAFLFDADGTVLGIGRGRGHERPAQVLRSSPPYTTWQRRFLDRELGGPLLARWGSHYIVGGRARPANGEARTVLFWLIDDQLVEAAQLLSGGDTSYPGFVALSSERALLSYYSSHEGSGTHLAPSAIYLARLSLTEVPDVASSRHDLAAR